MDARKLLGAPPSSTTSTTAKAVNDANADAASAPLWQRYGRMALYAGAAGAVAAGGAAAYMKRDTISEGWQFATSHLEFVGALARPEEMRKRLANIASLTQTLHIGFANIYTTLGQAVDTANDKSTWTGKVAGSQRTFCNLPKAKGDSGKGGLSGFFIPAGNDKAVAETWAHMSMFEPRKNPGYYGMSERAKELVVEWTQNEWYEESEGRMGGVGLGLDEEGEMVEEEVEEFENVTPPADAPAEAPADGNREQTRNAKRRSSAFDEYERVKRPSREKARQEL